MRHAHRRGKSLCYRLPAVALDGLKLVVSPLIALMKDQVDQLLALGLPVSFVNSALRLTGTWASVRLAAVPRLTAKRGIRTGVSLLFVGLSVPLHGSCLDPNHDAGRNKPDGDTSRQSSAG